MGKNMFKIKNDCAETISVGVVLGFSLLTLNRNLLTEQKYPSGQIYIQIQQKNTLETRI